MGTKEEISSFYFSEFPNRSKDVDLFRLFGCVGDVAEIFIPPKRNKFGKLFGFARFKNVEDERLMAVKLDNIIIDGRKIYPNQPRFNRPKGKGREEVQKHQKGNQTMKKEAFSSMGRVYGVSKKLYAGNKSYAVVVAKGNPCEEVIEEEKELPFISFNSDPIIKNRRKKAYIGEVMNSGESYNIQTHMEIEGFF